jgi:hypothetical protein
MEIQRAISACTAGRAIIPFGHYTGFGLAPFHSIVAGKITKIDILQNSKTFRGLKVHSNRISSSQQS